MLETEKIGPEDERFPKAQQISSREFEMLKNEGRGIVSLVLEEYQQQPGTNIVVKKFRVIFPEDEYIDEILEVIVLRKIDEYKFEVAVAGNA